MHLLGSEMPFSKILALAGLYSPVSNLRVRGSPGEPRKAKVTTALPFDPCDLVAVNRRLELKSPRGRARFEGFFNWRVPTLNSHSRLWIIFHSSLKKRAIRLSRARPLCRSSGLGFLAGPVTNPLLFPRQFSPFIRMVFEEGFRGRLQAAQRW